MIQKLLEDNRYRFALLFIVVYFILYTTNYLLTGLIKQGGIYNKWFAKHFDYVTVFRVFLLGTTAKVVELMIYDTYLTENIIYVKGGQNIRVVYSCMGINILCLWWAFVLAVPIQLKKKLLLSYWLYH